MFRFAKNKRIYMDYASLTPIDGRVLREMKEYSRQGYANPSSWYKEGVAAKDALQKGRNGVAAHIGAHADEIYFTAGGTEANNLAIIGSIESLRRQGIEYSDLRILVSSVEHSSVMECANRLSDLGVKVDIVPVDEKGLVSPEEVKKLIKPNTALVSIMTVNNEIGTIEPIREIAKAIRQARAANLASSIFNFQSDVSYPLFHTDAAQALYENLAVEKLGVDLLTLDGSKVYGPRGIGCLYVKRKTPIEPVIYGGGQEKGLRSGTENLPGIMGFAKALEMVGEKREKESGRLAELKREFMQGLRKIRSDIRINAQGAPTSPHILSVTIPGINNEYFVLQLDAKGIACSTKSSCLEDEDESYVLKAMNVKSKETVRFSFGRGTSQADVRGAVKVITDILKTKNL